MQHRRCLQSLPSGLLFVPSSVDTPPSPLPSPCSRRACCCNLASCRPSPPASSTPSPAPGWPSSACACSAWGSGSRHSWLLHEGAQAAARVTAGGRRAMGEPGGRGRARDEPGGWGRRVVQVTAYRILYILGKLRGRGLQHGALSHRGAACGGTAACGASADRVADEAVAAAVAPLHGVTVKPGAPHAAVVVDVDVLQVLGPRHSLLGTLQHAPILGVLHVRLCLAQGQGTGQLLQVLLATVL